MGGFLKNGGQRWNRTTDTRIFNPLLYRLSYLATFSNLSLESESAVLNRLGVFKSRIMHPICYLRVHILPEFLNLRQKSIFPFLLQGTSCARVLWGSDGVR